MKRSTKGKAKSTRAGNTLIPVIFYVSYVCRLGPRSGLKPAATGGTLSEAVLGEKRSIRLKPIT